MFTCIHLNVHASHFAGTRCVVSVSFIAVADVPLQAGGENLRWFPPYMKKAPYRPTSNAFFEKNDLTKLTTVLQFGYFGSAFSSLLGCLLA